jgi:Mlc titration factor MtfA (ptsG expression regulator)
MHFNAEDWKAVILSHETVVEEQLEPFNNGKTAGTINFTKKVITVRSYSPLEGVIKNVMLHEICHYIDRMFGDMSDTQPFQELYEQFKDGRYITFNYDGIAIDDTTREDIMYATSNAKEFFAEGLKDYYLHKEWLIDNYPDIYIYFNTYIKESALNLK